MKGRGGRMAGAARGLAAVLVVMALPALAAEPLTNLDPGTHNLSQVPPDLVRVPVPAGAETGTALICDLIAANAEINDMSPDFFARLIWKESRFDAEATSPVGARGIAQFMPYTARERGLQDPFDTTEAIRHSALYLRDLKAELGNWGLAAAAYNGGINRVKRWRADGGSLPYETEDYVLSVTARPADWFLDAGREIEPTPLDETRDFGAACRRLPIMKTRAAFPGVETAPMQPWGVQVAGHFNRSVAMKSFRRVQSRFAAVIGSKAPIVVRDRASRGRIYAVRLGADTRAEADTLCGRLRTAGGNCAVFKN